MARHTACLGGVRKRCSAWEESANEPLPLPARSYILEDLVAMSVVTDDEQMCDDESPVQPEVAENSMVEAADVSLAVDESVEPPPPAPPTSPSLVFS